MVGPFSPLVFLQDASGALVSTSGVTGPIYDYNGKVARIIPFATAVATSGMGRLLVDAAIASGNATIHLASGARVQLVDSSGIPLTVASGSMHFFPQNFIGLVSPAPIYGFDVFDVTGNLTGTSGANIVSGQYVRLQVTRATSTDPFNRLLVGISGQPIQIGTTSGLTATVGPQSDALTVQPGLWVNAFMHAFDAPGQRFNVVRMTESGSAGASSGTDFKLKVYISGQPITLASGQNIVLVSGQTVFLASGRNEVIPAVPTQVLTTNTNVNISAASGGTRLSNVPCITATIRYNPGQSGFMYMAGQADPPFSGKGLLMQPGEFVTLNINNLNAVRMFATTSGDRISCMVINY